MKFPVQIRRLSRPSRFLLAVTMAALPLGFNLLSPPHARAAAGYQLAGCAQGRLLCTEVFDSEAVFGNGVYVGHDEPSLLFYSNTLGSGNSSRYQLTLPTDPPTLPTQDGTGGTFNFQLHPAFWFGMAMCDTQSFPEFTTTCAPDTDSNIFDNPDPKAPDYQGHHPGTAFMEMQFYPPGWVPWAPGISCDATKWCAALNIDSLSLDPNQPPKSANELNNVACQNTAGTEYVNFAFVTKTGVAHAPANPLTTFSPPFTTITPNPNTDLFMNSGDKLTVDLHDTPDGFQVVINDLTTGQSGSMTASIANGFAQILFAPHAKTCTSIPYAFHPIYATSSEHTRVPWAAHSYNIAFSDEIGHFEYCNAVGPESFFGGNCTTAGVNDPAGVDADDVACFSPADSTRVQIGGCLGSDIDFDGPEYSNHWPGTLSNATQDALLNPSSILFTSPLFNSGTQNYDRVAFETDLPRIERADFGGICNPTTGANCVNPPPGANFYPFYTTGTAGGQCVWQLGGANIPGTTNTFGGSSASEFGSLLQLTYPQSPHPFAFFEDFRQVLSSNPCSASP